MSLVPGKRFAHYDILDRLGGGGMAEVYRARDLRLGRQLALKVLRAEGPIDPAHLTRFQQEATAAATLTHPNIVTIYEIGEAEGLAYIALEFVDGRTLRDVLTDGLSPAAALRLATQIADGLSKAHPGVVHRDLKPENIMVTPDGNVKILDFGIAKLRPDSEASRLAALAVKTDTGVVIGTVPYMSPEQARGEQVDHRSDQFSFGVIAYEMVAGRHPFRRGSPADTFAAIVREQPDPLAAVVADVPAAFGWIVHRCLSKDPADRYESTRDLWRDLQNVVDHLGTRTGTQLTAPRARTRARKVVSSLAVLPFEMGSGEADDYLSEGLTERLIITLSQVPRLKVMARSTVYRFKDRVDDPVSVGLQLHVQTVLTGRIVLRGSRVRVTAEVVDVLEGTQLWGAHYDRTVEEIAAIHGEIAADLTTKLRLRATAVHRARALAEARVPTNEAYHAYLRGRFFFNKRTPEGLKQGIEHLEQAVAIDPEFALAHAALADCYVVLGAGEFGIIPPKLLMPKAKTAAVRAVELDETLAEAHASLASTRFWYDWDWPGAEAAYLRAIELNPGYAPAHLWYGEFLSAQERQADAIAQCEAALDLDPLSVTTLWTLARVLSRAGQDERAIEEMKKAVEIEPGFVRSYYMLAWSYYQTRRTAEAIAAVQKAIELGGDSPFRSAFLGWVYARSGREDEARRIVEDLRQQSTLRYVSGFYIGLVHTALGNLDEAFAAMDLAVDERSGWMPYLKVTPFVNPLRNDPRFPALLKRVGLSS